jgi:hypothetical protein
LAHEELKKGIAPPDFAIPPSNGSKPPKLVNLGGGVLDNPASEIFPERRCQRKMSLDFVGADFCAESATFDVRVGLPEKCQKIQKILVDMGAEVNMVNQSIISQHLFKISLKPLSTAPGE